MNLIDAVFEAVDTLIEVGGNSDIDGVPPMYMIHEHETNTGTLKVFNDVIGGEYLITIEKIEDK